MALATVLSLISTVITIAMFIICAYIAILLIKFLKLKNTIAQHEVDNLRKGISLNKN